jgi:hypothetical protein
MQSEELLRLRRVAALVQVRRGPLVAGWSHARLVRRAERFGGAICNKQLLRLRTEFNLSRKAAMSRQPAAVYAARSSLRALHVLLQELGACTTGE